MIQSRFKIGLRLPLYALIAFAILFYPLFKEQFFNGNYWFKMLYTPQVFFLIATMVIASARNLKRQDIGLQGTSVKMMLAPIIIFLIILGLMAGLNAFAQTSIVGEPLQPLTFTPLQWGMLLIMAPIAEELFFRGILLHALHEQYSTKIAVLATSFIFMATHSGLFAGTLTLGLLTAILTIRSKSILPGWILHTLTNTLVWLSHNHFPYLGKLQSFLFF